MDAHLAVDLGREALLLASKLALPALAAAVVVGLVIAILQAATQVHEQTISFVPRLLAVVATLFVLLPWMLGTLVEYTRALITDMPGWFR
jgi:flagellar biosynthetic protein FliQ